MDTINRSDVIFATLMQQGRQVVSIQISGITSIAEVMRKIYGQVKDCIGLATLMLRNGTQGWARRQTIVLKPVEAVQLSLF
ncbi:MAG: hypothetical protein NC117_04065 [Pseudoflavonifractor sp.]|nr:hypothetical protein [Pseudoflavonifractor sp.]